ncbi:MAG: adhesin [Armatimonadota bacterium]|nr:helix-turn-helix domain-containing protein [bacterium]
MTREELREIGTKLWGPRWQTAMANALRVNARTVRKWLAGDRGIPGPVEVALKALLDARKQ